MPFRTLGVINPQIAVVMPSYINVVIAVAGIGISHIIIIAKVECGTCVEIPVSIVIPGFPIIFLVIVSNYPDTGQRRISLHFNVFHVNLLSSLSDDVKFHHIINRVIIRRYPYDLEMLLGPQNVSITVKRLIHVLVSSISWVILLIIITDTGSAYPHSTSYLITCVIVIRFTLVGNLDSY
jgi:hypothetical protein